MRAARRDPLLKVSREAVNVSRNEQQKSVLLTEVARQLRETFARLIERTCQLLDESQRLQDRTWGSKATRNSPDRRITR